MLTSIGAWHELLEHVPTERINEYFVRAGRKKKGGFPVNAYDIAEEWEAQKGNRRLDEHYPPSERGKWY